jgi:hypothetical protein
MRRLSFGVFLTALSTLILELMLTRAFDVTLAPNLQHLVCLDDRAADTDN